jgi:hypothetical protein
MRNANTILNPTTEGKIFSDLVALLHGISYMVIRAINVRLTVGHGRAASYY